MATQLGELEISKIKGATLKGYFQSIYEGNVYNVDTQWAAKFLVEAWEQLGEPEESYIGKLYRRVSFPPKSLEARLEPHIVEATFETPGQPSTFLTIKVDDASVFDGLGPIAWDSYYFG